MIVIFLVTPVATFEGNHLIRGKCGASVASIGDSALRDDSLRFEALSFVNTSGHYDSERRFSFRDVVILSPSCFACSQFFAQRCMTGYDLVGKHLHLLEEVAELISAQVNAHKKVDSSVSRVSMRCSAREATLIVASLDDRQIDRRACMCAGFRRRVRCACRGPDPSLDAILTGAMGKARTYVSTYLSRACRDDVTAFANNVMTAASTSPFIIPGLNDTELISAAQRTDQNYSRDVSELRCLAIHQNFARDGLFADELTCLMSGRGVRRYGRTALSRSGVGNGAPLIWGAESGNEHEPDQYWSLVFPDVAIEDAWCRCWLKDGLGVLSVRASLGRTPNKHMGDHDNIDVPEPYFTEPLWLISVVFINGLLCIFVCTLTCSLSRSKYRSVSPGIDSGTIHPSMCAWKVQKEPPPEYDDLSYREPNEKESLLSP